MSRFRIRKPGRGTNINSVKYITEVRKVSIKQRISIGHVQSNVLSINVIKTTY